MTLPRPADPRAALGAAIAARQAAAEELAEAEGALARGTARVRSAEAEAAQFDGLDQRIADSRARRLADWSKHHDEAPAAALFDITDDLAEARRMRDEARERLDAVAAAAGLLGADAAKARRALGDAADRVQWLAGQVLAREAGVLAEELVEAKRSTWELEDRLRALSEVWVGGQPLACPPAVFGALSLDRPTIDADRAPGMPFRQHHEKALWENHLARLVVDASAEWQWHEPERRASTNPFAIAMEQRRGHVDFVPSSLALVVAAEEGDEQAIDRLVAAARSGLQIGERAIAAVRARRPNAPPPFAPAVAYAPDPVAAAVEQGEELTQRRLPELGPGLARRQAIEAAAAPPAVPPSTEAA